MKKVEDMSVEELQSEKSKLEEALSTLREECTKIHKKILTHCRREEKINEKLDELTLDENDIGSLLETFPETKTKWKLLDKFLKKYYLSANGYLPETSQSCIRITLYKNNDKITEKTFEGINKVLPIIKPIKNGNKYFDIFESTLSANGTYYLVLTTKNEWKLNVGIHHRSHLVFSDNDLYKVLKYIQKNHYYEENY